MMQFKKFFRKAALPVWTAVLVLAAGCGYSIGAKTMMHPQIKSIAVADVKNDTLEPLASQTLRMQVTAEFQTDGALALKNIGESDCVLYARIISVESKTVREDSYDNNVTYRPAEFQLEVTVEFSVLIPSSGTPLVAKRTVTGKANYQVLADPAVSRMNALKYACYHAAQLMVEYTTEAW